MCKVLCLPIICLRWLIIITSVIILCLGGLIVWLGRSLAQQEIIDGIDAKYVGYVIIAFGGWLIVVGFVGGLGAYFRNICALIIYAKLLITTSLILIAFGGLGLHYSHKISDALNDPSACRGNDFMKNANDAVILGNEQICTPVCPCAANITVFGESRYANFTLGSATKLQDCNPCESDAPEMQHYKQEAGYCAKGGSTSDFEDEYYSSGERRYFVLLKFVENEFKCAGVCDDVPFFAFSDINNGIPTKNCREDLGNWVQKYPERYSAVVLAVGVVLLLNVFSAYCVACHPDRSRFRDLGYRTPNKI